MSNKAPKIKMMFAYNMDNQQRESKEDKPMPLYAAILKNRKQKQKTDENKNGEPQRQRDINRNKQQRNE